MTTPAYLFLESRDPMQIDHACDDYDLMARLSRGGHRVKLMLVQNGVLASRSDVENDAVERAVAAGVTVWADLLSLRERGIAPNRLIDGVIPASSDVIVDGLAEGGKAIWL